MENHMMTESLLRPTSSQEEPFTLPYLTLTYIRIEDHNICKAYGQLLVNTAAKQAAALCLPLRCLQCSCHRDAHRPLWAAAHAGCAHADP
eukprot:6209810-Pleurochrysis_carterae.AAC.1